MLDTRTYSSHDQPTLNPSSSKRVDSVDIVRGLAMIFMLLNHSSWHIPGLELEANNSWYDRSPIQALNGDSPEAWLSILQGTPLFFVLAGFSVAFFEQSRRKRQWSEADITSYLLIRGSVLIIIDFMLPGFALSSIGICLWMIAFLRRLPNRYLILLAIALTVMMQSIYEHVSIPQDINILRSIFLYPSPQDFALFGYPVLQWVAIIIFGYISGRYAITHKERFVDYTLIVGLCAFGLWFGIIVDAEFGRLFQGHPMIMTKHPPSLAYLSFYMGLTFTLLALISHQRTLAGTWIGHFLSLLGQVAFFFYISHFLVVFLISVMVIKLPLSPLMMNFTVMVLSLLVLFPICQKYKQLRRNHPESLLQYL